MGILGLCLNFFHIRVAFWDESLIGFLKGKLVEIWAILNPSNKNGVPCSEPIQQNQPVIISGQFIINPYPECFGHFQGGIPLRNYLFGVFPTGGILVAIKTGLDLYNPNIQTPFNAWGWKMKPGTWMIHELNLGQYIMAQICIKMYIYTYVCICNQR